MSDELETKFCTNCKHDILAANFVIHNVHCQRNISLCTKCQEPVHRNELAEHDIEQHSTVSCPNCLSKLEKYQLADHLGSECSHRKVVCTICSIQVAASELSEHENYCGARTEKCSECGQYVMLKFKQLHLDSNHNFLRLTEDAQPSPLWQNGRRTLGNFLGDLSTNSGSSQGHTGKKSNYADKKSVLKGTKNTFQADREKVINTCDKGSLDFETSMAQNLEELFDSQQKKKKEQSENKTKFKSNIDSNVRNRTDAASTGAIAKTFRSRNHNIDSVTSGTRKEQKKSDLMKTISWSDGVDVKSKRNNDQPQINRMENYKSKKENIKPNPLNNEHNSSDLDRMLALQLAEDEDKEVMLQSLMHDINDSDEVTSTNNISYRSNDLNSSSALLASGYTYDEDPFLVYDLPAASENGFNHIEDEVKLPCEFCNKLIIESDLILHQSGCKPITNITPMTADMTDLPCEFCNELVPVYRLTSHQLLCENKRRGILRSLKKVDNSEVGSLSPGARKRLNTAMTETGLQNGLDGRTRPGGTRTQLLQGNTPGTTVRRKHSFYNEPSVKKN